MAETTEITVAYGDGIGPEIMEAVLLILKEAGARLKIDTIEVGEKLYKMGHSTGIPTQAWDSLYRTKVLLKAPITTPQGGGYKSLNVTMRKRLGLYANVRPTRAFAPYIETHHPKMDLVIVRENEEDLYSGIEYRTSADMYQSLKLITRTGSERIVRYAFEYAVQNGRKKVTCMSKDNIMKMADGCFHKTFDEIAKEYPQIQTEHYIIDIGAARIGSSPERFDVIVTENLYGDIISDIAAEVSGSVGLAGSSNIGEGFAMFEAIHGSAPDISGQNIANPSGLLQGALMMLLHIGQADIATKIQDAWLKTIEDGIVTGDIFNEKCKQKVGTKEFADAVVARLGQKPSHYAAANYPPVKSSKAKQVAAPKAKAELMGVDIAIMNGGDVQALGEKLLGASKESLKLQSISCKGLTLWPSSNPQAANTDIVTCRYLSETAIKGADIAALITSFYQEGIDISYTYSLYHFDGERGFTLGQGE